MALMIVQPKESYQYETEWTLFNASLGRGSSPVEWAHEQRHVPYSVGYYCKNCGDVWARISVLHPESTWRMVQRRCPAHGYGYLLDSDLDDIRCLDVPYSVLVRELVLALKHNDGSDNGYDWQLILDGQ